MPLPEQSMLTTISKALAAADKVQLDGFGSFSVCQTPVRKGSHPDCGTIVLVPATKAVRFRSKIRVGLVVQ